MLDETHALSDITYRLNFILPDQCRSNELVNLCIIIKPLELLCGEEYKTLNGGLEEKGIPNARDLLREEICSSSSHLVHEIIFAVPVRKLASTTHISTQVCDQNGGSAQVRQRGRQGGESCERRNDLSAWNVNHWPQVIFCRVMLLWLTWLCNVPADANLKARPVLSCSLRERSGGGTVESIF